MKKLVLLLFVLPALPAQAQRKTNPKPFAKSITIENMQRHLYIIAGAEMEGRETATEGQRKAAAYIQNEFKTLGLAPGNNNDYQMYFPVYVDSLKNLSLSVNDTAFTAGEDFSVDLTANHPAAYRFSEVVFAGNGISDSTHDDYKGLDVKGKLVMVWSENIPAGSRKGFSSFTQQNAAMKNGATALLVVSKTIAPVNNEGNMYVNRYPKTQRINTFNISEKLAEKIVGRGYAAQKAASQAPDFIPQVYKANIALGFSKTTIALQSSNVLGILEGTDLKDEYVVLTAHYDHLGTKNGVIWYGADDDGSGTVTILELAKAFSRAKAAGKGPRRSILFMTVSGEEKGLWGSDYYSSHPALPLDKTTVNLNIDMIGRIDPSRTYGDSSNYIYVIGDDKLSSDLKPISEAVNKKYSKLELDYKYNDPRDPERIYYRSDHYNFAKRGVPVIFYFSGLHPDYHKPTDTPDKINYALMLKRAKLIFFTAWNMANRNDMLKRDIPLDGGTR
ncbi:M28 family peptidase [Agriterribacter sp.]|uniref:M28 family peptidase n=1 Tax=Agriterribacter sp. TaxID=2821509 RepID=UPI002B7EA915|nr:M28 family peptidase [Agriterribacter sp.]HRP55099.1 M28 family peptidase [Agriterribacter sp.]